MLTPTKLHAKKVRRAPRRASLRRCKYNLMHRYGGRMGEKIYRAAREGVLDQELQREIAKEFPKPARGSRYLPCARTTGDVHREDRRHRAMI